MTHDTKVCKGCGEEKPLSEFYNNARGMRGKRSKCKTCHKAFSRWYSKTSAGKLVSKRAGANPKAKASRIAFYKEWKRRYPEKDKAKHAVYRARVSGKLVKPAACEECGKKGRLHAHHEDYTKQLDVKWLCVPCHGKRHPNYIEATPALETRT